MVQLHKQPRVDESIRSIEENAWLVGNSFILRRHVSNPGGWCLTDGSAFWTVDEDVPSPPPPTQPARNIEGVFERLDYEPFWAVIWRLGPNGELLLKGKLRNTTHQAEIANMKLVKELDQAKKLSFEFPTLWYSKIEGSVMYGIENRLRGLTLHSVWGSFSEERKDRIAEQVATALDEISRATSDTITAADRHPTTTTRWFTREQHLALENDLVKPEVTKDWIEHNFRSAMGYDFVEGPKHFTHVDVSGGNILVDPEDREYLGIIDWERAAYYPRQAIATDILTCRVYYFMRLVDGTWTRDADYRDRLLAALAKRHFRTYGDRYWKWWNVNVKKG